MNARRKGRPRIEDRAKTIEARKPWLKLGRGGHGIAAKPKRFKQKGGGNCCAAKPFRVAVTWSAHDS